MVAAANLPARHGCDRHRQASALRTVASSMLPVVMVRPKHRGEGVLLTNRQGACSQGMRCRLRRRICEFGIGQSNSASGKSPSVEVSRVADHLHVDDGCEPVWSGV